MFIQTEKVESVRGLFAVRDCIESAESIVIAGHKNPDGDCIGSLLSLGLGLERLGKQVYMVCDEGIPERYCELAGAERVYRHVEGRFDIAIAVDCAGREMVAEGGGVFRRAKKIIEIDHHQCRASFGDYSYIDDEAASVGEMVFHLLTELGVEITADIAQSILTSIIVETNSFRLPGVRPDTFQICAELLKTGMDFSRVAETVFWVTSRETEILGGICLSRCRFYHNGQLACSFLTREDFLKLGAGEAHGDPVIEKMRSISSVKIAVLFREQRGGKLRVSFRSKEGMDVSLLAKKFGGGGHIGAAGCTIPDSAQCREELLKATEQLLLLNQLSQYRSENGIQNSRSVTTTGDKSDTKFFNKHDESLIEHCQDWVTNLGDCKKNESVQKVGQGSVAV
ncbi:DHH family phosphoesterase [Chitinispirillales bacterium ANBcel5]|uniref:DHH family phosphoesterase n=1 Tax=Cellulosispirillum alkaliphilum TaxID=3039283 RepID=UPI002A4FCF98|nr:DHH family phosphoesterase [Chitinispirillales bacterium ANBcel5]